jgi:hypothetical protein
MKSANLFRALALAGFAALLAPSAMAQAVAGSVSTTVNLSSLCRIQGGGAATGATVAFGAYTAFQAGANTGSTPSVTYECTRGFGAATPTIGWDGGAAGGVVAGLNDTLTISAPVRTPGTAATASTIGSGDTVVYTLGGTMPGGQAGAGAGGATSATRTLTVTF